MRWPDLMRWLLPDVCLCCGAPGGPVPNQGQERLTPIVPTPADRALLDLRKSDAAFFLERQGRRDGTPVEWRTTIIRGDRFRFVSDWTAGSQSQLRPSPW